jgi:hypothetical protein
MAGLDPATYVFLLGEDFANAKTWVPGTRPGTGTNEWKNRKKSGGKQRLV